MTADGVRRNPYVIKVKTATHTRTLEVYHVHRLGVCDTLASAQFWGWCHNSTDHRVGHAPTWSMKYVFERFSVQSWQISTVSSRCK